MVMPSVLRPPVPWRPFRSGVPRRQCHAGGAASDSRSLVEECTADNWRTRLGSLQHSASGRTDNGSAAVVALGKFDSLHRGHRLLVEQAASMGGAPWLISFSGMAQELGWQVRLPLVAPSERGSVLRGWASFCCGTAPRMRRVPFGAVRQLSPRDFVASLAEDLKAAGVVVGVNYRFGFKAAGTADTLKELGAEYGMRVQVMDLLGGSDGGGGNVSSSEVRQALGQGRLDLVEGWLGRPYSVIAHQSSTAPAPSGQETLQLLQQSFQNQPPGQGTYEAELTSAAADAEQPEREACRVAMEMTVMGQAILQPLHAWPPWVGNAQTLRLTF